MRKSTSKLMTEDRAEALALQVLTFILADPKQASRFLNLTGSTPQNLREIAISRDLQAATLEYLLSDEGLLLVFCQEAGIEPSLISPAHQLLQDMAND